MKIMLVCDSMDVGGAETHVLCLARELCCRGHSVVVVGRRGRLVPRLLRECSGMASFVSMYPDTHSPIKMVRYILTLGKTIKHEAPDVVHAHSRATAFAVEVLRKLFRLKCPLVVTAHAKYRSNKTLDAFSVWGDECIAVSDDVRNHLLLNYRVKGDRISVIKNGIDTEEFSPKGESEPHYVLFASRLDADTSHGARCLCKIADRLVAKYPDVILRVAGGGDELDRIKSESGSERIEFLGAREDIAADMREASLIVGVSRVALEAMSSGKNVILFGNEGALGLLDDKNMDMAEATNYTCRGCGVKDEELLFLEMERFFAMSEEEKRERGKVNRRVAVEGHSLSAVVDDTLISYDRAMSPPVRVVILGYYGFGNTGDEAILSSLLGWLFANARVSVCVLNKTKRNGDDVRYVSRYSLPSVISALCRSDVFILGGGSLLQNETSTRSLLYYYFIVSLARLLGCRCVMLSNGIGPLESRFARRIFKSAIGKMERASFRDEGSFLLARQALESRSALTSDLCFLMGDIGEESKRVTDIKSRFSNGYMLVSLKGRNTAKSQLILDQMDNLCKEEGISPIFVAMDESVDKKAALDLAARFGSEAVVGFKATELISLIKDARHIVGERLHFLIFALIAGKGFVGVGDSPKVKGFLRETLGCEALGFYERDSLRSLLQVADSFSPIELLAMREKNEGAIIRELVAVREQFLIGRVKSSSKSIEKKKKICYNEAHGRAVN